MPNFMVYLHSRASEIQGADWNLQPQDLEYNIEMHFQLGECV
jgi:hypothetical protein